MVRAFPVCWEACQAVSQLRALAVTPRRHAGFKAYLQRARQAGAVTGFVGGGSAATSPKARATLRTYEDIIGCALCWACSRLRPVPCLCDCALPGACSSMTEEEKRDLSLFGHEARQRAAAAARCSLMEVWPAGSPACHTALSPAFQGLLPCNFARPRT